METELRSPSTFWLALIVLGLLLCGLAHCTPSAYAEEEYVLPAGTAIRLPHDGDAFVLSRPAFLVERSSIDKANAEAALNDKLQQAVVDCNTAVVQATRPRSEPGWITAVKWAAVGVAIGGAFALGATL